MAVDDDPGWSLYRAAGGITALRQVFVAISAAVVVLGVGLRNIEPDGDMAPVPVAIGIALLAAAGQVAHRLGRPALDCSSDAALAKTYRMRFFFGVVAAEQPALFAFVGVFLTGERWVYLVGMACALVGLATVAPTRGRVRRDQEELALSGCGRSLLGALAAPGR